MPWSLLSNTVIVKRSVHKFIQVLIQCKSTIFAKKKMDWESNIEVLSLF